MWKILGIKKKIKRTMPKTYCPTIKQIIAKKRLSEHIITEIRNRTKQNAPKIIVISISGGRVFMTTSFLCC
jgi:hypothetical protein